MIQGLGGFVKQVAIVGNGQLANGVADALAARRDVQLVGPTTRSLQDAALRSGADVVVIATTTRLADVVDAVQVAVSARSNVIVSAEEAAYPWAVDPATADRVDALARARGVTVLGAGLNPGFVFDALVLTLLGTCVSVDRITVSRTVSLSGFGAAVRARLGLGVDVATFDERSGSGEILGHAGFPQSMAIIAHALGLTIERIETSFEPLLDGNLTAGVRQVYTAIVEGREWYRATFTGHLDLASAGLEARDVISLEGPTPVACTIDPGIGSQAGSQAVIVNSIDRVIAPPRPGGSPSPSSPRHIHVRQHKEIHVISNNLGRCVLGAVSGTQRLERTAVPHLRANPLLRWRRGVG